MDINLELYRSVLDLPPLERRNRLRHLPQSEYARVWMIIDREQKAQRLEELIAGRDLVQVALSKPPEIMSNMSLKHTILGRSNYPHDENMMVTRIANDVARTSQTLIDYIANFDEKARPLPLDAWKLVYCDLYHIDGGSAALEEIYEARLQDEELQTPAARARELVRDNTLKKARRNARWMIPAIQGLSSEEQSQWTLEDAKFVQMAFSQGKPEEAMPLLSKKLGYEKTLKTLWKQVSPAPPAWMQHIIDTRAQWGFVYYLSREIYDTYGNGWERLWSEIKVSWTNSYSGRDMADATWMSIHCQGEDNRRQTLEPLLTEDWSMFNFDNNLEGYKDFRRNFKNYIQEKDHILSPGVLRNTFIVIPPELVPHVSEDGDLGENHNLDPYWVWACDADWDNSNEDTIFNGNKYEGRVRVAIYSLNSWFYAACWEGVSLRDMWLKAQQHPEKLWICYTKTLEEWDHEPYI